jgi:small-conductance mechanosensitive channel
MNKTGISLLKIAVWLAVVWLLTSCIGQTGTGQPPETPQPTPLESNQALLEATGLGEVVPTLAEIAPTRTPMPTATPDALTEGVSQIAQETGLSEKTFFWLNFADWINLGISLIFVLIGYLIGTWLIRWLLPRLVRRTKTNLDDLLLQISANELRWMAVVVIFRFAIERLAFIQPSVKTFIADVSFFLLIFLVAELFWRLINLTAQQANARASQTAHHEEAESLITLITWTLRLTVLIFVFALTLNHFGVNITGFTFILVVIVFTFSLAGRDILTDIISGAMILIDSPFRIGDRLELPSLDSWGDVVEIGMRSTKILSMENRMVVLPNSLIGKNQVVNYSYPDPSYFNQVNVMVAYDNDPDQVAEILEAAIRSVEGVQTEREVVSWLMELNEFQMVYWTAWWVATYQDRYAVQDKVIRAMMRALREAGVVLPYQKGSLTIRKDESSPLSEALQEPKRGE